MSDADPSRCSRRPARSAAHRCRGCRSRLRRTCVPARMSSRCCSVQPSHAVPRRLVDVVGHEPGRVDQRRWRRARRRALTVSDLDTDISRWVSVGLIEAAVVLEHHLAVVHDHQSIGERRRPASRRSVQRRPTWSNAKSPKSSDLSRQGRRPARASADACRAGQFADVQKSPAVVRRIDPIRGVPQPPRVTAEDDYRRQLDPIGPGHGGTAVAGRALNVLYNPNDADVRESRAR